MPRHLLIVDDDPTVRASLADALEHRALRVSTAADGTAALAELAAAERIPERPGGGRARCRTSTESWLAGWRSMVALATCSHRSWKPAPDGPLRSGEAPKGAK